MLPQIRRAPRHGFPTPALPNRRWVEWLFALFYAAVLGAAVWQLDHGDLPRDATPVPTVTEAVARAQSLMLGFTEALRAPRKPVPLSLQQSAPEGWPLWTGGADGRTPDRDAVTVPMRLAH